MKIHRFIGTFDFTAKQISIDDVDFYNQVKRVLKLQVDEQMILGDGNMNEALVKIVAIGPTTVDVEVVGTMKNENEPKARITLYCSILKNENFETAAQKATEVGIAEIVPLICNRTIKLDFKKERVQKIIKEAAEQSGRGVVPLLHDPVPFDQAVKNSRGKTNFFLDASGVRLLTSELKNANIWIGPEGGWSPEELAAAHDADFIVAGLGKLVLRAETAVVVASYLATL